MASSKCKTRGSASRNKLKSCKENMSTEPITGLSLPVISTENVYSDEKVISTAPCNLQGIGPGVAVPKVILKCEALGTEKIIDFENNMVIVKKIKEVKNMPKRNYKRTGKRTAACKENSMAENKNFLELDTGSVPKKRRRSTTQGGCKMSNPYSKSESLKNKKLKITDEKKQPACKKKFVSINSDDIQETDIKEQNIQAGTSQNLQDSSSSILQIETQNIQYLSSLCFLNDKSELIDIILNKLLPALESNSFDEFSMKSLENKINITTDSNDSKVLQTNDSRNNNFKSDLNLVNQNFNKNKTSLQAIVETFMKNPQLKYLAGKTVLKNGLCYSWLSTKKCSNQQCVYSHNALSLFAKKLKRFPSKFIMTEVVSMRHDDLFVDVVIAAFKVMSERKIPAIWITFLTFFVFYVTEPSDTKFLQFWITAARFFCELKENYSTAGGFTSLLSIFSEAEKSEEWKIVEFIKLIRQPPVQVQINFALLQPVLQMDLPSEFLTETVKSCVATKNDVVKVYTFIIPKILIMKSPIQIVELLVKFSKILEEMNHKNFADDMKQRLRKKVLSFKSKIDSSEYPLTASFQEEIRADSFEENCSDASAVFLNEKSSLELIPTNTDSHYFRPEEDFSSLLLKAMEFSSDSIPSSYRKTEDVCERQISRIKQFFGDYRFDLLGKYLNEVKPNVVERVAEEFLKLLFQMKISLQQGVDLVKIILIRCKSENAGRVIASISITLILNLVRINQWKKAYTLVSMCQEKNIDLVKGKVFYFNELNTITEVRIVLLLIEIHTYKGNYVNAVELVRKHSLFTSNNSSWELTWKEQDEDIRIRILDDLLQQIISNQLTKVAYDLFQMIWKEQKNLVGSIDLKKHVNDILILLFNEENEEAVNLYETIKSDVQFNEITVRTIVVSLVRRNLLATAKNLVFSTEKDSYFMPEVTSRSAVLKVCSFWLEEEYYIIFDAFFDFLAAKIPNFNSGYCESVEIWLQESKAVITSSSDLRPLCLGIINPSFKDACSRMERVLEYQFSPPVKLLIMPYKVKFDETSLKLQLEKRISVNEF